MIKLLILFVFATAAFAQYSSSDFQIHWWDTDDNKADLKTDVGVVPFPQCLMTGSRSNFLQSRNLQKAFDAALREEEQDAKKEYYSNYKKKNYDRIDDYDRYDSDYDGQSYGYGKNLAAAAAIKLTRGLMTKLACDLNDTSPEALDAFLSKFNVADQLCTERSKVDCSTKSLHRMPSGLCNNLEQPFLGNSHTAFGRLFSANYQDYVGEPRSKSVKGGPLPSCRKLSLELGSKPIFNRLFNNHFTIFGQYIAHDIALSVPYTDTYSTPISSCTCDSKYSKSKCTIIDIPDDDPTLGGQKCMAFPMTAQAFKDEVCSLGVKEQLNGNTHFIDLSGVYGSTVRMSEALRYNDGLLKSTRRYGTRILPPTQREGKSCSDATYKHKCFAGGDSRLMINLLFTGIQTMFLRANNDLAKLMKQSCPLAGDNQVHEFTRSVVTAYFQRVVYAEWLPMLLGSRYSLDFNMLTKFKPTEYSADVKPVVYNEVATAAFRLHTLVRDLFSRCTPDGSRIDQLWLHDILNKGKYAYDLENYGLESILCGSLYDYGFAFDGNFAHQIHHRLFETTNNYGQLWRNDLAAINICRGREHGIQSFVKVWQNCTGKIAYDFKDFGSTINYDGIKFLKKNYKSIYDIDLFVGLNLEDPVPEGLVGPTSSCLLKQQFDVLKDGDRFFYSHDSQPDLNMYNKQCAVYLRLYPYRCFICTTTDLQSVPYNPFQPPSNRNPMQSCDQCAYTFSEYAAKLCGGLITVAEKIPMKKFLAQLIIEHIVDVFELLLDDFITDDEMAKLIEGDFQGFLESLNSITGLPVIPDIDPNDLASIVVAQFDLDSEDFCSGATDRECLKDLAIFTSGVANVLTVKAQAVKPLGADGLQRFGKIQGFRRLP